MYGNVKMLASASSNLTFEQLVRGGGVIAKADFRRLLHSRGARVRRSSTAAVAVSKTCPSRLKVLQTTLYGYETKALSYSEAVCSSIAEKLCEKLDL